jgi:hypothetical protein
VFLKRDFCRRPRAHRAYPTAVRVVEHLPSGNAPAGRFP